MSNHCKSHESNVSYHKPLIELSNLIDFYFSEGENNYVTVRCLWYSLDK